MINNLRDSGINTIGHISWGTHIANLFTDKKEIFEVVVPFIKSGLVNNELCLWIYTQNTPYEDIKSALKDCLEDIDSYMENGQLILIPYREWYLVDNSFSQVRINEQWKSFIKKSLSQGYEGLRAVADTSWQEKSLFRTFQHYEQKVNEMIPYLPFLVMCLYDATKLDTYQVTGITKNHNYIIVKYEGELEIIKNVDPLVKDGKLEEREEKYEKFLEILPSTIFIHDDKRIYYCNKPEFNIKAVKDKGISYEKSILEWIPDKDRKSFKKLIDKMLKEEKDSDYIKTEFIDSFGKVKNVEVVSAKYNYYGQAVLISVVRDITHFRKISELELDIKRKGELLNYTLELDKMKTEFFSNISHELRTPINVILGTIQLLELQSYQGHNPKDANKYLKTMKQNCHRLVRLVNNIIDLTKLDTNYYQIRKQNCNIVNLVEDITMSVVDYAKNKDISIIFDTNVEEKIIACDPGQVERIILNLLSNAIKFTQSGGKVLVSIYDYGEKIRIIVKDNGIGIPREKLPYIFNRFEQVDKSLKRQFEGSGIGLSIVKALVEKHNGKISVNSQLGKGSEFIIDIPCELVVEQQSLIKNDPNLGLESYEDKLEKVNIEFSDIYIN